MGKKVFNADLSVKSIENLKKQLLDYKDNELQRKVNLLLDRLSEEGLNVAKAKISVSPMGSKYVNVFVESSKLTRRIVFVGKVIKSEDFEPFNTLLAIEFGAGIHHNRKPNPNADKFGYGVGTFPNQIHAFQDGWYYWNEKEKKWKYTHGVKATMPMYEAEIAIRKSVARIAREVFE